MRSSSSKFLVSGLVAISLLALSACVEGTTSSSTTTSPSDAAGTPAKPPPTVVIPPPATATTTAPHPTPGPGPGATPAAGAAPIVGTWESAACGERTYPRRITFADASNFTAEDLVSPCPKGVACIWSGIINTQGTYRIEKDVITLNVEKTSPGPKKAQFPTRLTVDASGAPAEAGSDGKACMYKPAASNKP